MSNSFIWLINRTLSDATTPGLREPGKGYPAFPEASALLELHHPIIVISKTLISGKSYSSAEMQSVYFTTPDNWANVCFRTHSFNTNQHGVMQFFIQGIRISVVWILHHHHHYFASSAQISLTLSRHHSLSFIASGSSLRLHPVSTQGCSI